MSTFFTGSLNKKHILTVNQQIAKQDKTEYGLDDEELLDEIITNWNACNNIENSKERIVEKIACLIAGLAYGQPFKNGNKRTCLSLSILLLRSNRWDLPYGNLQNKKIIFDFLESLMYKFESEDIQTIVKNFLKEHIVRWNDDVDD